MPNGEIKIFKILVPIIIALFVTPFALLAGIASAGAGHGSYFWAKILFPYTMLSTVLFHSITTPFIVLAFLQFPLYGAILAFAVAREKLFAPAIILTLVHGLAAILNFFTVSGSFS